MSPLVIHMFCSFLRVYRAMLFTIQLLFPLLCSFFLACSLISLACIVAPIFYIYSSFTSRYYCFLNISFLLTHFHRFHTSIFSSFQVCGDSDANVISCINSVCVKSLPLFDCDKYISCLLYTSRCV